MYAKLTTVARARQEEWRKQELTERSEQIKDGRLWLADHARPVLEVGDIQNGGESDLVLRC